MAENSIYSLVRAMDDDILSQLPTDSLKNLREKLQSVDTDDQEIQVLVAKINQLLEAKQQKQEVPIIAEGEATIEDISFIFKLEYQTELGFVFTELLLREAKDTLEKYTKVAIQLIMKLHQQGLLDAKSEKFAFTFQDCLLVIDMNQNSPQVTEHGEHKPHATSLIREIMRVAEIYVDDWLSL